MVGLHTLYHVRTFRFIYFIKPFMYQRKKLNNVNREFQKELYKAHL